MFRFTTAVKGIAIDLDSFEESFESWNEIISEFNCLFITSSQEKKEIVESLLRAKVLLTNQFARNFIPNPEVQRKVLLMLNVQESELAYLSANLRLMDNALTFYSCVIYVANETLDYEKFPRLPDLVCNNLSDVKAFLTEGIVSYLGEECFSQDMMKPSAAAVPILEIHCDEDEILLISLGRYYGSKTYMQQLHPYSRILFLNKKKDGKAFRTYDEEFAKLLSETVKTYLKEYSDCICSVPTRKGDINRFDIIVERIAQENKLENISKQFVAKRAYGTQKLLSYTERQENVKDAFAFEGNLAGKRVILLDDIVTTGGTLKECFKTLKAAGAAEVYFLVLGVNQKEIEYGIANQPRVCCPICEAPMMLFVNATNHRLFYSCMPCSHTNGYEKEKEKLLVRINQEFAQIDEIANEENFDMPI